MAKKRVSNQQILDQLPAARERARRSLKSGPHAERAYYDPEKRTLHVVLTNGGGFDLPVDMLDQLRDAGDDVIARVSVSPAGLGLRWDALDEDLCVARLAQLVLGRVTLLRAAAASGGAVKSKAKTEAARANGLKGGRPPLISKARSHGIYIGKGSGVLKSALVNKNGTVTKKPASTTKLVGSSGKRPGSRGGRSR